MSIFKELDILLNSIQKINESEETKKVTKRPEGWYDLPISDNMKTAEQAKKYIRDYFLNLLDGGTEEGGEGIDEPITETTPPPPPISLGGDGGEKPDDLRTDDLIWDGEKLEHISDDEPEGGEGEDEPEGGEGEGETEEGEGEGETEEGEEGTEGGKEGKEGKEEGKEGTEEGKEEGKEGTEGKEEGKEGTEEGKEGTEGGEGGTEGGKEGKEGSKGTEEGKEGTEEGKEGKEGTEEGKEGKEGKEEGKEGTEGGEGGTEGGKEGTEEGEGLEKLIEDALNKLKEKNDSEKEKLSKLIDMLKSDETTSDDIEKENSELEREKKEEKDGKIKSMVGEMEISPGKEDIEKEIEASNLSKEEIEKLKSETLGSVPTDTLPKDEELDDLKKKAMEELERKSKGKSLLSKSILYHSLESSKIDKDEWYLIIEKILKKKSKHNGKEKSKSKKIILGDKNHIWRDVRYGKKVVKEGADTQSIYCFVDYSGSVRSQPGLITSFLGKVLRFSQNLKYSDLTVYTFGDTLSVPRVISKEMIDTDGYERVLTDTINFFELPENYVGGSIENFSEVAYEINRIKRKDKNAVFFIFGDGVWTFYGNTNPPQKLKEICPQWIRDIIAFVFYIDDDEYFLEYVGKEVSVLKDVVGIQDVIFTKAERMKK